MLRPLHRSKVLLNPQNSPARSVWQGLLLILSQSCSFPFFGDFLLGDNCPPPGGGADHILRPPLPLVVALALGPDRWPVNGSELLHKAWPMGTSLEAPSRPYFFSPVGRGPPPDALGSHRFKTAPEVLCAERRPASMFPAWS